MSTRTNEVSDTFRIFFGAFCTGKDNTVVRTWDILYHILIQVHRVVNFLI